MPLPAWPGEQISVYFIDYLESRQFFVVEDLVEQKVEHFIKTFLSEKFSHCQMNVFILAAAGRLLGEQARAEGETGL